MANIYSASPARFTGHCEEFFLDGSRRSGGWPRGTRGYRRSTWDSFSATPENQNPMSRASELPKPKPNLTTGIREVSQRLLTPVVCVIFILSSEFCDFRSSHNR